MRFKEFKISFFQDFLEGFKVLNSKFAITTCKIIANQLAIMIQFGFIIDIIIKEITIFTNGFMAISCAIDLILNFELIFIDFILIFRY